MEQPDAATEVLNNHDILQGVINCIREEKIAVAKQVMVEHNGACFESYIIVIIRFEWPSLFTGHPVFV